MCLKGKMFFFCIFYYAQKRITSVKLSKQENDMNLNPKGFLTLFFFTIVAVSKGLEFLCM